MPAYFELRVDTAEEVDALGVNIDFAFVAGAVEAAEPGVRDEFLCRLLRQIAVPTRDVYPTDAEFSHLPVGQWTELIDFEDDVCDVRERGADGNGLPRP